MVEMPRKKTGGEPDQGKPSRPSGSAPGELDDPMAVLFKAWVGVARSWADMAFKTQGWLLDAYEDQINRMIDLGVARISKAPKPPEARPAEPAKAPAEEPAEAPPEEPGEAA